MKVKVDFEADPPAFDLEDHTTDPLECSEKSRDWSLVLPKIKNNDKGDTLIELLPTETSEFFMFTED